MSMPMTAGAGNTAPVGADETADSMAMAVPVALAMPVEMAMPAQQGDTPCGAFTAASPCLRVSSGSSGHRDVLMLCIAFLVAIALGTIGLLTPAVVCRHAVRRWVPVRLVCVGLGISSADLVAIAGR